MPKATKEPKVKAAAKPKKEPKAKKAKPAKKEKDPNAPKRALGAYMFFCQKNRDEIKATVEGNSMGDIAKAMGAAWKELDDDAKKPYFELAEKDKLRYEKDMAAYKSKASKKDEDGTEDEEAATEDDEDD